MLRAQALISPRFSHQRLAGPYRKSANSCSCLWISAPPGLQHGKDGVFSFQCNHRLWHKRDWERERSPGNTRAEIPSSEQRQSPEPGLSSTAPTPSSSQRRVLTELTQLIYPSPAQQHPESPCPTFPPAGMSRELRVFPGSCGLCSQFRPLTGAGAGLGSHGDRVTPLPASCSSSPPLCQGTRDLL